MPQQNTDLRNRVSAAITQVSEYLLSNEGSGRGTGRGWNRYPRPNAPGDLEATCMALIWLIRRHEQKYAAAIHDGIDFLWEDSQRDQWAHATDQLTPNQRVKVQTIAGLSTFTNILYILESADRDRDRFEKLARDQFNQAVDRLQEWNGQDRASLTSSAVYWTGSAILIGKEQWNVVALDEELRNAFLDLSSSAPWPDRKHVGWKHRIADHTGEPALGPTSYITYLLLQNPVTMQSEGTLNCIDWIRNSIQAFSKDAPNLPVDVIGRCVSALLLANREDASMDGLIDYLLVSRKEPFGWLGDSPEYGIDIIVSLTAFRALWEWNRPATPRQSVGPSGQGNNSFMRVVGKNSGTSGAEGGGAEAGGAEAV